MDAKQWALRTLDGPEFRRATDKQKAVEARLIGKGWIDPFMYRRSITLALPDLWLKRERGIIHRSCKRRPVRITPTGRILS